MRREVETRPSWKFRVWSLDSLSGTLIARSFCHAGINHHLGPPQSFPAGPRPTYVCSSVDAWQQTRLLEEQGVSPSEVGLEGGEILLGHPRAAFQTGVSGFPHLHWAGRIIATKKTICGTGALVSGMEIGAERGQGSFGTATRASTKNRGRI